MVWSPQQVNAALSPTANLAPGFLTLYHSLLWVSDADLNTSLHQEGNAVPDLSSLLWFKQVLWSATIFCVSVGMDESERRLSLLQAVQGRAAKV